MIKLKDLVFRRKRVLSEIDKNKQVRYGKISLDSQVLERVETKIVEGEKVQVKTNKIVTKAIREQAGTGELDEVIISETEHKGGTIPQQIITSQQVTAYNAALSVEGKAALAKLLEEETYMLDPSKAYLEVIRLGNELGQEDKSMINPYLSPDIDLDKIRESMTLTLGNAINALIRVPKIEDFKYIKNIEKRQKEFKKALDEYSSVKKSYAKEVSDAVNLVADGMIQSNVIGELPKP